MDPEHAADPIRARWLIENKRRWPLAIVVAWGWGAALFAALAGAGREAARARLPGSRAAVAALEPAAVEEGRNAAAVWLEAIAALEELAGREDGEAFRADRGDGASAESALTREQIERCAGIFELVEEAVRHEGCDWGLEYSSYPGLINSQHPALSPVRRLARLCARRVELAGSENDWERVERSAGWILTLVGHIQSDPVITAYLIGISVELIGIESIRRALEVSTAAPPLETVRLLKAAVRRRLSLSPPISRILEAARRINLEGIDMLGAGEINPKIIRTMDGPVGDHLPPPLNAYMVVYPLDRNYFQEMMDRLVSESEAWEQGSGTLPDLQQDRFRSRGMIETFLTPAGRLASGSLGMVGRTSVRRMVLLRSAVAALAVLEFRLDRGGAWPESLAEVELDPEEPVDPWSPSRESLRYGILADGSAAVWSAGESGELAEEGIDEIAMRFLDGEPIGFRVPMRREARDGRR